MRISIIAPNLNEIKTLGYFIESLESQSDKDFEVVMVDGKSHDGSLELLNAWAATSKLKITVVVDETRNIGYIRNVGARHARADILFHTSSDLYFPPDLIASICLTYINNQNVISLSGRTYPIGSGILSHLAYGAFDFMRWLFTVSPFPVHKYRPGGNFTTIKTWVHNHIGGFPEVKINEDGLYGQRIDEIVKAGGGRVVYDLGLYVAHKVKRFEKKGGLKAMLFYLYVFSNMFPILKRFLDPLERRSGDQFATRADLGVKA